MGSAPVRRGGDERLDRFLEQLAALMEPDLDRLVDEFVDRIFTEDAYFARVGPSLRSLVRDAVKIHLTSALRVIAGRGDLREEATRELARASAVAGVPIASLLNAYRLAAEVFWEHLVRLGRDLTDRAFSPDEVLEGVSVIWKLTNHYGAVISEAYDETVAERVRRVERDRAALLDALFDGRMTSEIGPGDLVHRLGLPDRATFVAVVAEGPIEPDVGDLVEEELQSIEVRSVWRVGADRVVGVIVLHDERRLRPLADLDVRLVHRFSGRVGVSPPFAEVGDVPDHVALADVARRCAPAGSATVVHHEQEPIATLAVSVPSAARRSARAVLEPVLVLAPEERANVIETVEAWMASGGSTSAVAERLYCHRNTARNRLARVEALLGRPLADPKVAAELVLAMTAWRLDPDGLG